MLSEDVVSSFGQVGLRESFYVLVASDVGFRFVSFVVC
jgi:hypothetical protein